MENETWSDVAPEVKVRRLARQIIVGTFAAGHTGELSPLDVEIAQLTAGLDPDAIDKTSPDYIFGASDAFASSVSSLSEMLVHPNLAEKLKLAPNAKVFAAFAGVDFIPSEEVGRIIDDEMESFAAVNMLHYASLIQYGVEEHNPVWRISPYGDQAFMRLLPELAQAVDQSELLKGVGGWLERKASREQAIAEALASLDS